MATSPRVLPSGRVTFAFIDVVGSTKTFAAHGDAFVAAVTALHDRAVEHTQSQGGAVVATEGDGAFLAFPDAGSAVRALSGLQAELEGASGDDGGLRLRIRSGAHTGDAVPVGDNYLAFAVHVAARVAGAANAGQVLVTDEVLHELTAAKELPATDAVDTGIYRLKDLSDPVRIWRLFGDDALPRATPARRTNVEPPRTSFVGRVAELEEVRQLVAEPGLVTVIGPGGTGKTRLVSEFALADSDAFEGGVWLVELATLDDADLIVPTVGDALGLTGANLGAVIGDLQRRGRCVLVVDNCEHLLDPVVDLVEELCAALPNATVLCTSREALRLLGERVMALAGLAAEGTATDLYLDRAALAARTETDLHQVAQLCAALDGLPLAIELAASQARTAPLTEILEAVLSGKDSLGRRGGQERQRSLDAVLEWSLGRLPPATRNSLLTLAVFPGRFTPDMARTVLAAAPRCDVEATRQLARASLIDLDGDDYRLLSTVRAAALRQLSEDPELHEEALDALASWASDLGVRRFEIKTYHDDVPSDTLLAVEAALAHGLDAKITGLGKAWNLIEVVAGVRGATPGLLALAKRAAALEVTDADEAWTPVCAANLLHVLEVPVAAEPVRFDQYADLARAEGDGRLLTSALSAAAKIWELAGDDATGLARRLEQVEASERPGCRHNLGMALGNLGRHYWEVGDYAAGEQAFRAAADVAQEANTWAGYCVHLCALAEVALHDGRYAEGRDYALDALKVALPEWRLRGYALAVLTHSYLGLGDRASALATGRLAVEATRPFTGMATDPAYDQMLVELPELLH
ncbi:hypothetical protein F0U44_18030 [Nocardioides humilatus]|uniref:Guanylate cyclase domain-containing protein n=2 Tax=Nocardioides humilatus TaxID=2607660 RepID=A0A5B1L8M2_9ACTN|nr:hypothetical protein F0U44_18030 [Nocardioides humilatus]